MADTTWIAELRFSLVESKLVRYKEKFIQDIVIFSSEEKLIIGRSPTATNLQVDNLGASSSVSRIHCSIKFDKNYKSFMITDESSTNGTFVADKRLSPHEPTQLHDGDEIVLGSKQKDGMHFVFVQKEILGDTDTLNKKYRITLRPEEDTQGTTPVKIDVSDIYLSEAETEQPKHTFRLRKYHDVFISYSRTDIKILQRVRRYLDKTHDLAVWTDEILTPGTQSWQEAIEDGIETSVCVMVLMSPSAKKSEWVRKEINYARSQKREIIPVLVRGNEQNAIPLSLVGMQYIKLKPTRDSFTRMWQAVKVRLDSFES